MTLVKLLYPGHELVWSREQLGVVGSALCLLTWHDSLAKNV